MEDTIWTKEQLEAITENNCNLLVAAAAGAGKTAVLVERIIRKITNEESPTDIDSLLIVTFTNASATEMRERIAEAISTALELNPDSKVLQRQLTLLNKASITTIHSFCLEVIKNNFQNIDLDPNFRIANETEALLLKTEALEELFEDIYENENESGNGELYNLLECYGGNRDDQKIQELVITLYGFVQSYPWPDEWLSSKAELFSRPEEFDFADSQWGKELIHNLQHESNGLKDILLKTLEKIQFSEGLIPYFSVFQEDLTNIETLIKICNSDTKNKWDSIFYYLSSFEFNRLPICKGEVDKLQQEYVKSMRDDVKSKIKYNRDDVFSQPSKDIIKDLEYLYPLVKYLSSLVMDFSKRYSEKKRKKNLLDFNDLEHFCLEILTERNKDNEIRSSTVAQVLKERFTEVLVDEYQDSNLVQEIIINMISKVDMGNPNIFMVGDVKQSIYRFRQAKPELFMEKYNSYTKKSGDKFRKVQLSKNFRSRKEVVDCVNFLFKQIMSEDVGELEYNDKEALNHGSRFEENLDHNTIVGGATELHLIDIHSYEENECQSNELSEEETGDFEGIGKSFEEEEFLDAIQCEARIVAKRIKELMLQEENAKSFKVYDRKLRKYRNTEFKDIVILLRTTRNWSDIFLEELSLQGIPAFADSGNGFFKTVEVQIMLSLLQIIDNPLQDIPLLAVLRSPIAAFTQDELIEVRLINRKASLFDALKELSAENKTELSSKATNFIENLEKWRKNASYMPTDELIWHLYTETGFFGFTGAMPGGKQRQSNLRILFERARQFEESSYKGLFNFVNFVNKLKSNRGDMGSAKILSENENVVRIMSIHKSKGLEFPVVILSGCGKRFNLQDMNQNMLLHQELGFGPDLVDFKRRISYPSTPKQALRSKIKIESLSEEMRILYVAFTRAKEKLIITGSVNNLVKTILKWSGDADTNEPKILSYSVLKGRNYLDWIGPAVLRHKSSMTLRKLSGSENKYFFQEEPSNWEIRTWDKNDILIEKNEEKTTERKLIALLERIDVNTSYSSYKSEIQRRLNWNYKYMKASEMPVKLSVTEIKRHFPSESTEESIPLQASMPTLIKKPKFMEESKGLNSAEIGTALHFVMQHLDFKTVSTLEDISLYIDGMVIKELLTPQQADAVNIKKIHAFISSPLGLRLLKSEKLYREVPFNLEISSREFFKDLEDEYNDEKMLLQGVIDCYFEEQDGIVLLDYKTDYIKQGNTELFRDKYKLQLDYYTMALEQLTGKKVKEKYIYFFYNGSILKY